MPYTFTKIKYPKLETILNLNHGFLMSYGKVLDYVEIRLFSWTCPVLGLYCYLALDLADTLAPFGPIICLLS